MLDQKALRKDVRQQPAAMAPHQKAGHNDRKRPFPSHYAPNVIAGRGNPNIQYYVMFGRLIHLW
jgi:hypothetical protein